jgi:hypothetical protein
MHINSRTVAQDHSVIGPIPSNGLGDILGNPEDFQIRKKRWGLGFWRGRSRKRRLVAGEKLLEDYA